MQEVQTWWRYARDSNLIKFGQDAETDRSVFATHSFERRVRQRNCPSSLLDTGRRLFRMRTVYISRFLIWLRVFVCLLTQEEPLDIPAWNIERATQRLSEDESLGNTRGTFTRHPMNIPQVYRECSRHGTSTKNTINDPWVYLT